MPNSLLTIRRTGGAIRIPFAPPMRLMEVLQRAQMAVPFPHPCAGTGSCGNCRVALTGRLAPRTESECRALQNYPANIRLSCQALLLGDAVCTLPDAVDAQSVLVGSGAAALSRADFDPAGESDCGIAVDIGTTTVAVYLYQLAEGTLLGAAGSPNAQGSFGSDVIARIVHAGQDDGAARLQDTIVKQLQNMITAILAQTQIDADHITRMVITGNTTMLHLLTGRDVRGIGVYPFTPDSLFGYSCPADTLFGALLPAAELYFPPCISAYVGADIVCGIMDCRLTGQENALLIDVGTNGEMVLYHGGNIVCCATAAGPAFEGRDITMGMAAAAGAVNSIFMQDDAIAYTTIGDAAPAGICGTGIISGISTMLHAGILDETGALEPVGHAYPHLMTERDGQPAFLIGDSALLLTQRDIRKIQLSKAAIAAGVETLLHECALSGADIAATYLSGGFGSYIPPQEAADIGLLPHTLLPQLSPAGNTAGNGAAKLLFAQKWRREAEAIAKQARDVDLSSHAYFVERYTENMLFLPL